ncbi:MAG: catalase-related domain-containing protein, partial [Brachybacterium tyrofermentans]
PDAQRNRIGTNFNQLPVNRPIVATNSYDKEGSMEFFHSEDQPVYAPNSYGRKYRDEQGPVDNGWEADGEMVRAAYTLHADDGDFVQPGIMVREVFDDAQRDRFVETVSGALSTVEEPVLSNALQYWKNVDTTIGERIELAVNTPKGDDQPGGDPLDA